MLKVCLFYLLIQPIFFLIENLFYRIFDNTNSVILAVITVSVAVVGLCLPFSVAGEKIVEKNEKIKKDIADKLKSIKNNFKGDEKYLLIKELYKKHNYSPLSEIQSLIGILIQIPFFIAAFLFFSNLHSNFDFSGMEFFTQPDGLINIKNIQINLLPILMFCINIISVELYLKSINSKKRLPLYIAALAFLAILYREPSILVVYWTINNILYLIRNLIVLFKKNKTFSSEREKKDEQIDKNYHYIFLSVCVILTFLLSYGLSPIFMNYQNFFNESKYLFTDFRIVSFCLAFGTFFLYPMLFYFAIPTQWKKILAVFSQIEVLYLLTNYIIIFRQPCVQGQGFAEIPPDEIFGFNIISFVSLAIITALTVYLFKKGKRRGFLTLNLLFVITICLTGQKMLLDNIHFIDRDKVTKMEVFKDFYIGETDNKISLSKDKENVIFFFFDSASGHFLNEQFLKEEPQYKEKFDGFVNYTDTLSPMAYTVIIQAALLAGNEYLPDKYYEALINNEFQNFSNESVLMLPTLFSQNNFKINFVNYYVQTRDLKDEYKNIIQKAYKQNKISYFVPQKNPAKEFFKDYLDNQDVLFIHPVQYFLSVFDFFIPKCVMNKIVKDEIQYKYMNETPNYVNMSNYCTLFYLPEYIGINSSEKTYTFFYNNITHDCFPTEINKKTGVKLSEKTEEFCKIDCYYNSFVNTMFLLSRFFEFLKENGIYDNTKIIISTDHGMRRYSPEYNYPWDTSAVLLVKDFNKRGVMKSDNSYAFVSDVPYLLVKDVISNPKNPFTNKPMIKMTENEKLQYPVCGWYYDCFTNLHNKLNPSGQIENSDGTKIKKYILDNQNSIYYPDPGDSF